MTTYTASEVRTIEANVLDCPYAGAMSGRLLIDITAALSAYADLLEQREPAAVPIVELQALAERWGERAYGAVPDDYVRRGLKEKYLNRDNEAAGIAYCVDDLGALIALHAQPVKRSG